MMVRIAAMLDRLKSIWVSAKKPTVRIASWTSVATAAMPNCHSKRNQM